MSRREPEVLERNLEALFRRARQPLRPSPEFVARLERELAPWLGPGAVRRDRLRVWTPRLVAVAAGLVLGLVIGWRVLESSPDRRGPAPLARLLADGEVALRELPSGRWRAATDQERREGLVWTAPRDPSAGVEVATPVGTGTTLRGSAGLELALSAASRVRVERGAGVRELRLLRGALELRVPTLFARVTTPQGEVLLADAAAKVAIEPPEGISEGGPPVRVRALSGRARLDAGGGVVELDAPRSAWMHAGEVRVVEPAGEGTGPRVSEAGPQREPLPGPGGEAGPPMEESPDPALAHLSGVVRDARSDAPIQAFEVTLLRAVPLPAVAWPESRAFEDAGGRFRWDGLAPGEYTITVQVEGRAPWRARGELLAPGATVELDAALGASASLRGAVVERGTGVPIAGALVVAETDAPVQVLPLVRELLPPEVRAFAVTGPDGSFLLEGLSPGAHVLRASVAGHGFARSGELELRAGDVGTGLLFELGPGGAVEGRVEGDGGAPREGARVIVSEQAGFGSRPSTFGHAVTGADGRYRVDSLAAGRYVVLVAPEEQDSAAMRPEIRSVVVVEGESAGADFLREPGRAGLRGRLLDAAGAPMPGATVNVMRVGSRSDDGWRAASAQEDGAYVLADLDAGAYDVYLGSGSGVVRRERVELGPGELLERDYRLEGQSLSGRVTDAATGDPIEGYVLFLARRDGAAAGRAFPSAGEWVGKSWPGSARSYELPFLPPGLYDLVALTEGGTHALTIVEAVEVGADAPARADVALPAGGGARVLVVDEDGAPVAGAEVALRDPLGRHVDLLDGRTGADGARVVGGLVPGTWRVTARAEGRGEVTSALGIDAGARRELRLVLEH